MHCTAGYYIFYGVLILHIVELCLQTFPFPQNQSCTTPMNITNNNIRAESVVHNIAKLYFPVRLFSNINTQRMPKCDENKKVYTEMNNYAQG